MNVPGKKVVVIYHDDLDGVCSAAIAKRGLQFYYTDIEFIKFSWSNPNVREFDCNALYMVDCVLPVERLKKEVKRLGNLNVVWIDHHISTIDKYKEFAYLPGIREAEAPGACTLTWNHFFEAGKLPPVAYHIGDRDIWKFESPRTKAICEYFFYVTTDPDSDAWQYYLNLDDLEDIYQKGGLIRRARLNNIAQTATVAYYTEILDHKCIAINYNDRISKPDMANFLLEKHKKCEIAMVYYQRKGKECMLEEVSLYSRGNVDVSEIARVMGGGGHKGAAGFVRETR